MRLFAAMLEEVVRWTKQSKKKKSPLDKGRIATSNEGFTGWSTSGPKKKIKFKECGCLPDCGCKK